MSPVTILSSDLPVRAKALSGQKGIHLGSPPQVSQRMALCELGLSVIAPNSQAWMHQSQPLHLSSSTIMAPVSLERTRAFSGQAEMQAALMQALQANAALEIWLTLTVRIRYLIGLKIFSFS